MKILFIIARYFPYSGLQTDFLRAAEAAADRGHDVTCLVGSWEGERPDKLKILTTKLPETSEADDLDALETAFHELTDRERFDRTAAFELIPCVDFYFAGFDCLGDNPENADPTPRAAPATVLYSTVTSPLARMTRDRTPEPETFLNRRRNPRPPADTGYSSPMVVSRV